MGSTILKIRSIILIPDFLQEKRGGMPESETIMDRRGELAGIESMKVEPNGKSVSPTVLKKSLKGVGRIASVNLVDKGDNFFATVVDRKRCL